MKAQTAGTGEFGGGGWAPRPTPPPTVWHDVPGRTTSRGRECGDNERGGNLLPRNPLTTDR